MAEPKSAGIRWAGGVAAFVAILAAAWITLSGPPDEPKAPRTARAQAELPAPGANTTGGVETPSLRIAEHGRLTLDAAEIPDGEPLVVALDLPDEARRGNLAVRIVSTDGRRIDTSGRALTGAGSGVGLEIAPNFLTSGRYMIEIETSGDHPLKIRRYVLEVN